MIAVCLGNKTWTQFMFPDEIPHATENKVA